MALDRRRATLRMTVEGQTLADVLTFAKLRADAYFDGAPYEFLSCDATPMVRSHGGDVVLYEADVMAAAIPQRTAPPPWADPVTKNDDNPDDDTEEVPIP